MDLILKILESYIEETFSRMYNFIPLSKVNTFYS